MYVAFRISPLNAEYAEPIRAGAFLADQIVKSIISAGRKRIESRDDSPERNALSKSASRSSSFVVHDLARKPAYAPIDYGVTYTP
jgi:hypothetical protein